MNRRRAKINSSKPSSINVFLTSSGCFDFRIIFVLTGDPSDTMNELSILVFVRAAWAVIELTPGIVVISISGYFSSIVLLRCENVENTFGSPRTATVSYTHLRAHETRHDLVCRLLLEKKKTTTK